MGPTTTYCQCQTIQWPNINSFNSSRFLVLGFNGKKQTYAIVGWPKIDFLLNI